MDKLLTRKFLLFFTILCLASLLAVFLSTLGTPVITPKQILTESLDRFIYLHHRLPRFVLAFLVGGALSVSGVAFQSLLKNPLADPYILGVSGGAALGYVLAVIFVLPFYFLPFAGFVSALLSLLVIYRLACTRGVLSVPNLLLIGVVFNAFSFALILILNTVANFNQTQQILYLLLGSIDSLSWMRLLYFSLIVVLTFAVLMASAVKLNVLSLGDEEAFHLGAAVNRDKKIVFVMTSLLIGASVSLCGLIGFIGLIVPHAARLLFGADNRLVLPASALFGGALLMVCEFVASQMFSLPTLNTRLPVGAVTALIGAPVFVFLLRKHART